VIAPVEVADLPPAPDQSTTVADLGSSSTGGDLGGGDSGGGGGDG
jgi:hypothetical protein